MDSTLARRPTHQPRDTLAADVVPNHAQDMTGSLMAATSLSPVLRPSLKFPLSVYVVIVV